MKFIQTEVNEPIQTFRKYLYESLTSPIDAMWELLYITNSQHYLIEHNNEQVGYCCIDDSNSLLQLFLSENHKSKTENTIQYLVQQKLISSARLSSNEPIGFNISLLHSKSICPHTFCFEYFNDEVEIEKELIIDLVSSEEIWEVKEFMSAQIGFNDTFGYTENLVNRKELFLLRVDNKIIATSEVRNSDTQKDISDIGIIVHKDFRGKGLATKVLKMQANRVLAGGRKPICSTTSDNHAAQKAIQNAGFYTSNIIFDIKF